MKIGDIISQLEILAHPTLQENYDNAGLLTGSSEEECSGVIICLDATEEVIREAKFKKCNLVISHHPIIFGSLKSLTGKNYSEKSVVTAIKNDIAIYAIHTNLDNTLEGVNGKISSLLGLTHITALLPRPQTLKKLFTFCPTHDADRIRNAIFLAGGGQIGNYSECSFNTEGTGTFKAGDNTKPYVGIQGERHNEKEVKIEVIFPAFLEKEIVRSLKEAHPYEEVAYDVIQVSNTYEELGSGVIGELKEGFKEKAFLEQIKKIFNCKVIRHSRLMNHTIKKVALCGGAGSFLIPKALALGADAYLTADIKYHEFFEANDKMLIADIGHYESEQFTINLIEEYLLRKFPTFAVLKTQVITNPVNYYFE